MRRSALVVAALLTLAAVLAAQDNAPATSQQPAQDTHPTSRLTLKVVTGSKKRPVGEAHVVVQFSGNPTLRGKLTSWETKTDKIGVAVLDGIPYGAIRVQVIADGFQTYGEQHDLSSPEEVITISLNPPQGQVSSY